MPEWFINEQGLVRSGWKVLGFFLLFNLLSPFVFLGLKVFRIPLGMMATSEWVVAALGASVSFICLKLEGRTFSSIGFKPGVRWLRDGFIGLLGGLLIMLLTALVVRGVDGFHLERVAGSGIRQLLAAAWLLLGVGFCEEIYFRGYPFQRLLEGAGPWVSQLVFAGFFAWMHWGNPGMHGATKWWATLNIGLAGILLGFCYLRTQSLALPIGVHLGWNWAQGSLLGFGVSGMDIQGSWSPVFHGKPEWLTGGAFGLEASLPCTLVCCVAILGLWRWKGGFS